MLLIHRRVNPRKDGKTNRVIIGTEKTSGKRLQEKHGVLKNRPDKLLCAKPDFSSNVRQLGFNFVSVLCSRLNDEKERNKVL